MLLLLHKIHVVCRTVGTHQNTPLTVLCHDKSTQIIFIIFLRSPQYSPQKAISSLFVYLGCVLWGKSAMWLGKWPWLGMLVFRNKNLSKLIKNKYSFFWLVISIYAKGKHFRLWPFGCHWLQTLTTDHQLQQQQPLLIPWCSVTPALSYRVD